MRAEEANPGPANRPDAGTREGRKEGVEGEREELRPAVLLVVQAPRMPLWIFTSLVLFYLNILGAWPQRSPTAWIA